MSLKLDDCIVLGRYIYIGGTPHGNSSSRGLRRSSWSDRQGGRSYRQGRREGETINKHQRRPGGSLMGWAKPHIGGGLRG
jgi:hypothetical protein